MRCDCLPFHPASGVQALAVLDSGRVVWPILGGDHTPSNPVLARLLTERDAQIEFIDKTLSAAEDAKRDLVQAETDNLNAARKRIAELDAQIEPLRQFEELRHSAAETAARALGGHAPSADGGGGRPMGGARDVTPTYRSAGAFLVDHLRAHGMDGQRDEAAARRVTAALGGESRAVANQTTAQTPGLLPEPIVGPILTNLDEARPLVGSLGAKSLESIPGKVFHRPHVTQHTVSGKQAAEKTELPSRQLIIDSIPFAKETHGGTLNVSRQDIDWTSPPAWDAIIADMQAAYAADTDDSTAAVLAAAVTQSVEVTDPTSFEAWVTALYQAAAECMTGNDTVRASSLRMPDVIYTSVDQWAVLGAMIDQLRAITINGGGSGTAGVDNLSGTILTLPRIVVPGLPDGTVIIGRKSMFEFYEQRIGLLSAVEPSILGVEVAYGGYTASGALDATAWCKITEPAVVP